MKHTTTGKYKLKNPKKYKGNKDDIIYRSTYELKMMTYLDESHNVLEWSSENVVVPYKSPIDNQVRKYYIDFYAKIINEKNEIESYLFEVKPKKFTQPPKERKSNAYIKEVKEFLKNQAKWQAAELYCKENNFKFKIITEENLNL